MDGPPFPWAALVGSPLWCGCCAVQADIPISAFQTFISTLALSQIGPSPAFSGSFSPNWRGGTFLQNSDVFHHCLILRCQNEVVKVRSHLDLMVWGPIYGSLTAMNPRPCWDLTDVTLNKETWNCDLPPLDFVFNWFWLLFSINICTTTLSDQISHEYFCLL